jgi:hypothetical protein
MIFEKTISLLATPFFIGLILELNLGAIVQSYGSFRWRRSFAYFWLLMAMGGVIKYLTAS